MVEIRSKVSNRQTREDCSEATCSIEQDSRASLKRASISVLPDERTESKRVNSTVEMEARESYCRSFSDNYLGAQNG